MTVCEWAGRAKKDTHIKGPSWPEVARAIRALDGLTRNDLYLFPDADTPETYLCVGGGCGRYIVGGAIENNEFPSLANPNVASEPKQSLVVGGQEGLYPGNRVVDLEAALRAAQAFYDQGAFTEVVPWVRE